jgi:hypothetical protein
MLNNSKSVDVDTDKEEWEDESQDKEDDDDDDYDDWLVVWTLPKNMKVSWNDYSQYMEKYNAPNHQSDDDDDDHHPLKPPLF